MKFNCQKNKIDLNIRKIINHPPSPGMIIKNAINSPGLSPTHFACKGELEVLQPTARQLDEHPRFYLVQRGSHTSLDRERVSVLEARVDPRD